MTGFVFLVSSARRFSRALSALLLRNRPPPRPLYYVDSADKVIGGDLL